MRLHCERNCEEKQLEKVGHVALGCILLDRLWYHTKWSEIGPVLMKVTCTVHRNVYMGLQKHAAGKMLSITFSCYIYTCHISNMTSDIFRSEKIIITNI